MDPTKKLLIGALSGLILTFCSLAIPKVAISSTDLKEIHFGRPFWFVQQNITAIDRPLPRQVYIQSPWENPTDLRLIGFFGSWILLSLIIVCSLEIILKIKIDKSL
jgi:hypothetical protein